MIELIIKKLIEAANKKRDALNGFETEGSFSFTDAPVIAPEIKLVTSTPPLMRQKSGRVFGIFPAFVICAAIALIPFWKFIWPDDPNPGFKVVTDYDKMFELEVPESMQELGASSPTYVGAYADAVEGDPEQRTFVLERVEVDVSKTIEAFLQETLEMHRRELDNFSVIENADLRLDSLPAKALTYEFQRAGEGHIVKVREVMAKQDNYIWKLTLVDDKDDFEASSKEFNTTMESFYTW